MRVSASFFAAIALIHTIMLSLVYANFADNMNNLIAINAYDKEP